jgi:hypothetical protein
MTLPKCAVRRCANTADPRWFARDANGHAVMICDGHEIPLGPDDVEEAPRTPGPAPRAPEPGPEFCLPEPRGCEHQQRLAVAFSEVLAVFRRAAVEAPGSLASNYDTGDMTEGEVHRHVVTRLQEVHFVMQLAIARGYRVT